MTHYELLPSVVYEGAHSSLAISRPAPAVAVVVLAGSDIGEFADLPMRELAKDLSRFGSIDLFVDARAMKGTSIEVSKDWALWIIKHRLQFKRITVLTGSRYFHITAEFVRRFTGLFHLMRVFTDQSAFDEKLRSSVLPAQVV